MESANPQWQAHPQMSVKTLDDFKCNCTLMDDSLTQDYSDPTQDIQKFITWLDFFSNWRWPYGIQDLFLYRSIPQSGSYRSSTKIFK